MSSYKLKTNIQKIQGTIRVNAGQTDGENSIPIPEWDSYSIPTVSATPYNIVCRNAQGDVIGVNYRFRAERKNGSTVITANAYTTEPVVNDVTFQFYIQIFPID